MVHQYQLNGYNIVLDINSGCIHVVDEVTYEVLPYMEEGLDTAAIVGKLGDQFSEEDIKTSVAECEKLKADGMLFTRDVYENAIDTFTTKLLKDLEANKEQCQKWVDNSVGIITALLPHLGYDKCSAIAKEAYNEGTPIKEILMREKLFTKERMDEILSPIEMTTPGIAGGKK